MVSLSPYSVIIPAYNARDWIADAIQSATMQSPAPATIIVIDDGSTDGTAEVVTEVAPAARLVRQDNAGPGAATTRGLSMVETPVVAMLDADDVWLPGKMEAQLLALGDAQVSGVFTHIEDMLQGHPCERTGTVYEGWLRSTLVFKTEVARSLGPIEDPEARIGEMIGWIASARANGRHLIMLPQVFALRRIHDRNSTRKGREDLRRAYMQVVLKNMRERRAQDN